MYYLVYILAAFGIFFILILLIKFTMWCLKCDFEKQFVPIGASEMHTMRNNSFINENEAIDQMDKMLEQYTKPKTIISRQCICPFCTKETEKLIIKDHNSNVCEKSESIEEEIDVEEDKDDKDDIIIELEKDDNSVVEVDELITIEDTNDHMQCKLYNNVVSELKTKFSSENTDAVEKDDNEPKIE